MFYVRELKPLVSSVLPINMLVGYIFMSNKIFCIRCISFDESKQWKTCSITEIKVLLFVVLCAESTR